MEIAINTGLSAIGNVDIEACHFASKFVICTQICVAVSDLFYSGIPGFSATESAVDSGYIALCTLETETHELF